jgi:hypothetical protein
MIDRKASQKDENTMAGWVATFGGLDQLDWLMIVLSVLLGTMAKRHHFLGLPDGFLGWILPFLLMVAGYKTRRTVTELIESRRAKTRSTTSE